MITSKTGPVIGILTQSTYKISYLRPLGDSYLAASYVKYIEMAGRGQIILLTKTTAAQNEVALSYHRVRGQYFLTVTFVATIIALNQCNPFKFRMSISNID